MSPLAHPKGKTPSRSCNLRKGVLFSAYGRALLRTTSQSASQTAPLVGEPLAKRRSFPLCQSLPSVGEVALRSNDGEVEPGSGSRSGSPSYNLSVSLRSPAPLVGEPLAKPFTLRGLPKPPLGRSNGDDRRQWRKQGGAVGAAASRMRAAAKQTLGAATRAVALRSNDGEVEPGGGARQR